MNLCTDVESLIFKRLKHKDRCIVAQLCSKYRYKVFDLITVLKISKPRKNILKMNQSNSEFINNKEKIKKMILKYKNLSSIYFFNVILEPEYLETLTKCYSINYTYLNKLCICSYCQENLVKKIIENNKICPIKKLKLNISNKIVPDIFIKHLDNLEYCYTRIMLNSFDNISENFKTNIRKIGPLIVGPNPPKNLNFLAECKNLSNFYITINKFYDYFLDLGYPPKATFWLQIGSYYVKDKFYSKIKSIPVNNLIIYSPDNVDLIDNLINHPTLQCLYFTDTCNHKNILTCLKRLSSSSTNLLYNGHKIKDYIKILEKHN